MNLNDLPSARKDFSQQKELMNKPVRKTDRSEVPKGIVFHPTKEHLMWYYI